MHFTLLFEGWNILNKYLKQFMFQLTREHFNIGINIGGVLHDFDVKAGT